LTNTKEKSLSSPQDLGVPPEIPEGEDSLKNMPRFKPNSMKMLFWIIIDQHERKKALITSGFGHTT